MNNLVLASKSPRRIDMLKQHGISAKIMPSDYKEKAPLYDGMLETPMYLSFMKAADVESVLPQNENPYIIAADTIVYSDKVLGKPKDKDDALEILMSLSGKSHYVVTGYTVIKAHTNIKSVNTCITEVVFDTYTENDIADYLNTDEPYDKAGGYAIQGYFSRFIKEYHGSLDNVIGFPLDEIMDSLKEAGYEGV